MTKKNYKEIDVYYIGYVTVKKIANCNNINSVNPLYLMIDKMIGHFEEKSGNKYLVLDDVNEKQRSFKKIWRSLGRCFKEKLKRLMVAKKLNMGKIFLKNRFESNDDLSLIKAIKLLLLTMIIRSAFREDGKFYPQLFLDEALYALV